MYLNQYLQPLHDKTGKLETDLGKMFAYMELRFDDLESKIETMATKEQLNKVYDLLDGLVRRFDDEEAERSAMKYQLDRHEVWHQKTAEKIGLQLQ